MSRESRVDAWRGVLAWGAAACVGILLLTTFTQAMDSCEFTHLQRTRQTSAVDSVVHNPTFCLICAAAHSTPLKTLISFGLVAWQSFQISSTLESDSYSRLQKFALFIRPPPNV
jgi:hypothetical protein